jgi:hypothetical protein
MSYGVAAYGTDGKLTFHSDYSSIVYSGEMSKSADPTRPTYTGSYHIAITPTLKTSNYDMGWIVQYTITLDVDYMVPFYKPAFNGQEIAIMDVINEGTTWVVNLLFSGNNLQYPYVYAFAPLTELPSSAVTLNNYGIAVYDENSDLVFTDSKRPLRIDDVVAITHGTTIKSGSKGTCSSNSCHVDFTPDTSTTYTGAVSNTTSKLYHIVPSAYGGLAYENSGSGREYSCDWFGILSRPYAWSYKSWTSFRGTVKHPRNGSTHVAGWQGDFAGAAYQYHDGDCGFTGFFGALVGVFLVVFTGGAALAVIGGALAGFAIGSLTTATTPSLKAYDTDETFDVSNTVNLLVTDTSYYGITDDGDVDVTDRLTYSYNASSTSPTYWYYATNSVYSSTLVIREPGIIFYAQGGFFGGTAPASTATTYTVGSSTYYRGPLQNTVTITSGGTTSTERYYSLAIAQG